MAPYHLMNGVLSGVQFRLYMVKRILQYYRKGSRNTLYYGWQRSSKEEDVV